MVSNRLKFDHLLIAVYLLSVFLLAVSPIVDTDTWTHLSFGRWIFEHKQIPLSDPFIKTDMPFPYQNWLFGLIYYLVYHFFSFDGVIFFKALTVTAAFFILLKDALRPYRNYVVAVIVMAVMAIVAKHRFVERPDTFLMIFLPFSIFSLNAFVYDGKKYIYVLPLIHMLWANSHTSLPLMFIPFAAFVGGGVIQYMLGRRGVIFTPAPSLDQIKTILYVFVASFVASLVSPYFIAQYASGAQVMGSDWWRHEIVELIKPTWKDFKAPYIISIMVAASFIFGWSAQYLHGRKAGGVGYISLIHFLLVLPFIWLSFTAVRFIFLLGIIAGPIIVRNISAVAKQWGGIDLFLKGRYAQAIAFVVLLSVAVPVVASHDPKSGKASFGLGVNYEVFPEAALAFMDKNKIEGNVFNLFQWGGYITWRDFPVRRPFIDGRGFLSSDLLEKTNLARNRPAVFDELEREYGFEAVILNYPIDVAGISGLNYDEDKAFSHPNWALVYWDDLALVYLKRGGKYDSVVKTSEYKFVKPANSIEGAKLRLMNQEYRTKFVAELLRNISETGSSIAHAYLGIVYNESGLYSKAIEAFSRVRDKPGQSYINVAYSGIAYAYGKLNDVEKAIENYRNAIELSDDPLIRYKIGLAYLSQGDERRAVKYLSRAIEMDPRLLAAYPVLISTYRSLGMNKKAEAMERKYESAVTVSKAEEHFKAGLEAYLSKRYDIAAEEFKKSIDVNPWNPVPYSNLGYIYFGMGLVGPAFEYQKKALEIDPNYANAHYGLALIYKQAGDKERARQHWEEYLRLEPTGYYSRKAREEISAL